MLLAIVAGLAAPNVHNLPTTVTVFGICKASPAARGISTQTARRRLNLRHFGWRVSGCSRRAPSSSQGADKSRIPIVKTYRFDSVDSARERRESESNRRTRLCRPLHDHSAIPPETGAAARSLQPENERESRVALSQENLERETSLELATSTLARLRSTN